MGDKDCCDLIKSTIPKTLSMPKIPTHQEMCSKCKGQGPDAMKKFSNSNCSSTLAVQPQAKQFSLAAFVEEHTPQGFRAQDDAQCEATSDDCKMLPTIPDTGGVTGTLVLKEVSKECCSSFSLIEADVMGYIQNRTIPKNLSNQSKEDISNMCKQCGNVSNTYVSLAISALKAQLPDICNSSVKPAMVPAAADITV